jgi:hypothetical protein
MQSGAAAVRAASPRPARRGIPDSAARPRPVPFRRADGRLLPDHVDPAQFSETETPVEDDYADIPPDAATTRWIGDRLDRHYAISVLARHRKKPADRAS